jgi:hypothetical protein
VPPTSSERILIPADVLDERGIKYANPADIPVSPGGEIEDEAIDRSHEPRKAEGKSAK